MAFPLAITFASLVHAQYNVFFCPCLAWGGESVTRSTTGHIRDQCSQGVTLATLVVQPHLRTQA